MDPVESARFVKLAIVGDLTEGHVLVARLHSEGIDSRLHGEALGPYPVTVGRFAEVGIWVLSDRFEQAGEILLDTEMKSTVSLAETDLPLLRGAASRFRMGAIAIAFFLIPLWIVVFAGLP